MSTATEILKVRTEIYEKVVDLHTRTVQLAIDTLEAGQDCSTLDLAVKEFDEKRDRALDRMVEAMAAVKAEAEGERDEVAAVTDTKPGLLGHTVDGTEVYGSVSDIHCTYECGGCVNGEICDDVVEYLNTGEARHLVAPTVSKCGHTDECATLAAMR